MGATIPQTTASGDNNSADRRRSGSSRDDRFRQSRLNDILSVDTSRSRPSRTSLRNEFIDPTKSGDDAYVGPISSLVNYIGESLGVEVRIKPMDFTSVLGSITTGKYDLAISALAYTPARAETMNLSKGYYFGDEDPQTAYGILVRKEDVDSIKSFNDSRTRLPLHRTVPFRNSSYRNRSRAIKIQPCFFHKTMVS